MQIGQLTAARTSNVRFGYKSMPQNPLVNVEQLQSILGNSHYVTIKDGDQTLDIKLSDKLPGHYEIMYGYLTSKDTPIIDKGKVYVDQQGRIDWKGSPGIFTRNQVAESINNVLANGVETERL